MDIIYDKIPATQVSQEYFGMTFLNEKARKLWQTWCRENGYYFSQGSSGFLKRSMTSTLDVLIPSEILKGEHGNTRNHINPITEFIMYARQKGLVTNRMSDH